MSPKQPIHQEFDDFGKSLDSVIKKLSKEIRDRLGKTGKNVTIAVDDSIKSVGYTDFMRDEVTISATTLMARAMNAKEIVDVSGTRKWWLNHLWPGDDMTLSQRINDISRMGELKEAIRIGFREKRSWTGTARELSKRNLQTADLPKHITELERASRRLLSGQPGARRDYQRALRKSMREVERLQKNGAPTARLKKSYQNLIKATDKHSVQALDKAMDRVITGKARYNSDRIARTEMAKAYAQGTYQEAATDPDVIGIRYDLSAGHVIFDICDFHTQTNQFNLGPGGYPLKQLPPYPFHPQCTCVQSMIYQGVAKNQNKGKAVDWIKKQSPKRRQELMGKNGSKQFNKNNSSWQKNVRNYDGYRTIETLRQKRGIETE